MQGLFDALKPGTPEWLLAGQIQADRLPAHIAIIMDGNGRWARRRHLPRVAGHKAGIASVRSTVETCAQMGIAALTLYAFSVENWKRPRAEVDTLWRLLRIYLRNELPTMMRNGVRLSTLGRMDDLAPQIRRDLEATCAETASNTGLQLNLALNYGGRAEIVDAVRTLIDDARKNNTLDHLEVTEAAIGARLYTAGLPDPDLLIRTSGEMRVSNFLLWQIAYAELYVTETLWPDFDRAELLRAVVDYQKRDRRFGGLTSPASSTETTAVETPLAEALGVPR